MIATYHILVTELSYGLLRGKEMETALNGQGLSQLTLPFEALICSCGAEHMLIDGEQSN